MKSNRFQNLCLQNFKQSFICVKHEFKAYRAKSVDPDEAAHYELPHLDLYCLQPFLFLALQVY